MMGRPRVNREEMEANIPAKFRRKFPRACPREGCGSLDVKFLFFIRRNRTEVFTQPRYRCNGCKKGFTRGGKLQRAAATATVRPAAKVDSASRRRLLLLPSSSSESRSLEQADVEASAAEEDEARVKAEEPANGARTSEGHTGGERREAQINPPAQMECGSEDNPRTPAPSMDAKVLLREKIKKHLCNAAIVLVEIQVEKYALEACHNHRATEELSRSTNRELSAVEEMERMQRDMFVALARKLKAENGKAYEYSFYRYNLLRKREDDLTNAEEAVAIMQTQVENMKIDRVSHSELMKIEKKAQTLRKHVYGLDEY